MNNLQRKSVVVQNPLAFSQKKDLETWIVNSVKLNMVTKFDQVLETEGRVNLRKLFFVPIFSISEMEKRITEKAPEMKTVFYKELANVLDNVKIGNI